MLSFTKNKQTDQYDVIGPANEMREGKVTVAKRDGTTTSVTLARLSREFVAKFGDNKGRKCRIGTVAARKTHCCVDGVNYKRESGYCYYPCPVTHMVCSPENGPCHDCV